MKINFWKVLGVSCILFLSVIFVVQQYSKHRCQNSYSYNNTCYIDQYRPAQGQNSYQTFYSPSGNSVQNVYVDMKAKEFSQTQTYLNLLISKYNGQSISLSTYQLSEGKRQGSFVFEIPPYYLQEVLTDLRNLGQVVSENSSSYRYSNPRTYYYPTTNVDQLKQEREQWLKKYAQQNDRETSKQIEAQLVRLAQEIQSVDTYGGDVQAPAAAEVVTVTVTYLQEQSSFLRIYQEIGRAIGISAIFLISVVINMVNSLIAVLAYLLPVTVWIVFVSLVIYGVSRIFRKDRIAEE